MSTTSFSISSTSSRFTPNSKPSDTNPVDSNLADTKDASPPGTGNDPQADAEQAKKIRAARMEYILNRIRGEIRSAVKQSGITMVRSRFDTSDIVQESMVQIWKQLADADIEELEFTRGLLSVIAKGHARKLMRFHTANKRSIKREQGASDSGRIAEREPLGHAEIREEIGLMLSAMKFIHPVRQLVIFRRFFDGDSYQKIGEEICRSKEWVRQQCLKAQKEIRIIMKHPS